MVSQSDTRSAASGSHRPRSSLPVSPPPDAVLPLRSPHAPAPGEPITSHYRWCVGCGVDHPAGLHMQTTAGEGLSVHGEFLVTDFHQGAPGLAHGGVLVVAIDEILGTLNRLLNIPAVTGRIECDFRRPVPVGTRLHVHADIVGVSGRKVFTRGIGRLDAPDGKVAVTAAALFILVPLEHFVESGTSEYVRSAVADRAAGGPAWWPTEGDHDRPVEVNP